MKPPRVGAPGEEIKPLGSEECATFLEASHVERLEALYVLAVHCGLREGELLALRWEDVYLEAVRPTMLVRRTLTRGEGGRGWVVGASTKSGKGRRVRLTRQAASALKDHRKRQLAERLRLAGLWQDQDLFSPTRPALYSTLRTCVTAHSSASRYAPTCGKTYASTIYGTRAPRYC